MSEAIEKLGVREKHILLAAARGASWPRIIRSFSRAYPHEPEMTEMEVTAIIQTNYGVMSEAREKVRRVSPGMPSGEEFIDEINYWIDEYSRTPETLAKVDRLLQVKGQFLIKKFEADLKIKRPFIETARKIYDSILQATPGIKPEMARRELQAAIDELGLGVNVDDVLAYGGGR